VAYSDTIVSYLDVLGFTELVKASERDPTAIEKITNILEATERKGGYPTVLEDGMASAGNIQPERRRHTFSDLVVRTTSVEDATNRFVYLFYELEALVRIQWELLKLYGVLVRGGVCLKKMNRYGFLFGPGLVRSYVLAEKIAVFPRIVIDADLMRLATEVQIPWDDLSHRGEDGQYFVDYLKGTALWANSNAERIERLSEHKTFVLGELKKKTRNETVRQKLIWLALYHNRTVDEFIEKIPSMQKAFKKLKISEPKN
jgi:hypothetical protein